MDAISIDGRVNRSNESLLGGAVNASREGNSGKPGVVPAPDAVPEVRVGTNTYDAQSPFSRTSGSRDVRTFHLRVEMFNECINVQWPNPSTTVTSNLFGR